MSGQQPLNTGGSIRDRAKKFESAFSSLLPPDEPEHRTEVGKISGTVSKGTEGVTRTSGPVTRPGTEEARGTITNRPVENVTARQADQINNRLKAIEKHIGQVTAGGARPMVLKGACHGIEQNFTWVDTQVGKLPTGAIMYSNLTKASLTSKADELKRTYATAKRDAAAKCAEVLNGEADEHAHRAGELTNDKTTEKTQLFKTANGALTELADVDEDWKSQVAEASAWLGDSKSPFTAGLGKLTAARLQIEEVIATCIPPLTSEISDKKPGESTGSTVTPITDERAALRACGDNWAQAKQVYGATPKEMQKLANFRKKEVDDWLAANLAPLGLKRGPGEGWVSVGSTDPTSDYDISVNRHGKKGEKDVFDYEMVKMFNDAFRSKYGTESGTIFDTNLYASVAPMTPNVKTLPEITETRNALNEMKDANDIGSLMKMRRYMSEGEFEAFRAQTLESIGDGESNKAMRDRVEKQFDIANSNYLIAMQDMIESMEKMIAEKEKALKSGETLSEEEHHAIEAIRTWRGDMAKASQSGLMSMDEAQKKTEALGRELEHLKDVTLKTTNEVYTEQTGNVRKAEVAFNESQANVEKIRTAMKDASKITDTGEARTNRLTSLTEELGKQGCVVLVTNAIAKGDFVAAEQELDKMAPELLSKIARAQALKMFYANEAYQSDGPFAHVVTAGQQVETDIKTKLAKEKYKDAWDTMDQDQRDQAMEEVWGKDNSPEREKAEKEVDELKSQRRVSLPPEQCLQSFNEQLGDFLKDLEHYGDDDPGVAIVRTSEYLERLLDALKLMNEKKMFEADTTLAGDVTAQVNLQKNVKGQLIGARKGLILMEHDTSKGPAPEGGVDQTEQRRAFACEFMKTNLGVTSISGLAKVYVKLSTRVNARGRQWLAAHWRALGLSRTGHRVDLRHSPERSTRRVG